MRGNIVALVERYVGRGKFSGESNIMFRCPFHKGGEETKPSFSVNVDLGIFQCFTCKTSGNIIKLLKNLGVSDSVIDAETHELRKELDENRERLKWKKRADWLTRDPFLAQTVLPEAMLRPYLWCPTRLVEVGFQPELLQRMEIGFDRVNQRITYPIRDLYGNLAGISGGASVAGQYPKYKVYKGGYKEPFKGYWVPSPYGDWFDEKFPDYDFHNHHFLWNFDSVYPSLFFGHQENPYLILTEGFKACLWLIQNGYLNTVALMHSTMSERQASLVHRLRVNVILFLDNDPAGREGTRKIARELRKQQPGVFIAQYPHAEDCQPDDLEPEMVLAAIKGSKPYPQWERENRS